MLILKIKKKLFARQNFQKNRQMATAKEKFRRKKDILWRWIDILYIVYIKIYMYISVHICIYINVWCENLLLVANKQGPLYFCRYLSWKALYVKCTGIHMRIVHICTHTHTHLRHIHCHTRNTCTPTLTQQ